MWCAAKYKYYAEHALCLTSLVLTLSLNVKCIFISWASNCRVRCWSVGHCRWLPFDMGICDAFMLFFFSSDSHLWKCACKMNFVVFFVVWNETEPSFLSNIYFRARKWILQTIAAHAAEGCQMKMVKKLTSELEKVPKSRHIFFPAVTMFVASV